MMFKTAISWLWARVRNTFTHEGRLRLPPRPVIWIFGALVFLMMVTTVPPAAVSFYNDAIADGISPFQAFTRAAGASIVLLLVLSLTAGMCFYALCTLCLLISDLVSGARAVGRGIRKVPDAVRTIKTGCATAYRSVTSMPSKWRGLSAKDKGFAKFMLGFLAVAAVVGYALWPVAGTIHGWLPEWLQHDPLWMGILFVDLVLCVFATHIFAILTMTLVRLIRPRRKQS